MILLLQQQWGEAVLAQFVISLAVLEQLINYLFWLKSCQAIYWRKHIRRTSERRVTLIFVSCEKWTIFSAVPTNTRFKREGLSQSGFCWPMRCCKRHIWHNADCSRTAQLFQDVQSEVCSACYIDMYFTSSHSPLQGLPFNTYFILQQCDFDLIIAISSCQTLRKFLWYWTKVKT